MDQSSGKENWWKYMIAIDDNFCFGMPAGLRDCSKEAMDKLGINSAAIA